MKKMVFFCERCPANAPADSGYTYIVPKGWCEIQADVSLRFGSQHEKEVCEIYYCPTCFQQIKSEIKLGLRKDLDQIIANRLKVEIKKEFDQEQQEIENRKILNRIKNFLKDPLGLFVTVILLGSIVIASVMLISLSSQ